MNIGIIIQARMSSTRLPGKILKKIAGKEVLWHVVERCKKSKLANEVIVATSEEASDNIVYNYCKTKKIDVFRGNLNNVLKRFYDCAKKYKLDMIIRITSDCPFIDAEIIDNSIKLFKNCDAKYVSNCLNRTFPRGLDCEIFSFSSLEKAYHQATTQREKEHVTPYIVEHNKKLPYQVEKAYEGNFRLTLDEIDDYRLIKHLYDKFYQSKKIIDTKKIIKYLNCNPDIAEINAHIEQKHSIG
ncbi:glycosyltransferase family protein [bacterium]|nr:glycosyltransferase family protein [bacterium]